MSIKDFPKKCLGCKKESIPLTDYKYIRRKGKNNRLTGKVSIHSNSVTFPTCDTCEIKFDKAMKAGNSAKKNKRRMKLLIFALPIFILIGNFTMLFSGFIGFFSLTISSILMQLIIIAIISLIIILMIIQIIKANSNPYKIDNFITFHKDKTYSIVDSEYAKEVKEKIQERVEEEVKEEIFGIDEENTMYCPKCGNQLKKGTDFCKKCGKDLRVV